MAGCGVTGIAEALIEGGPAYRWWLAGYQSGVADGYRHGLDEANQGWTDVTTLACRTGAAAGPRPSTRYRTPALTAEEIRAKAEASWAEVERKIERRAA